ncbi:hypothetical protein Tco_1132937 [Tanacetum coccineum]|uniref:Uncharacterized protein n=1 Tax=Tanacetum coccineum TaxID=301880 RepID=A0ABQ5JDB7_9ASTR
MEPGASTEEERAADLNETAAAERRGGRGAGEEAGGGRRAQGGRQKNQRQGADGGTRDWIGVQSARERERGAGRRRHERTPGEAEDGRPGPRGRRGEENKATEGRGGRDSGPGDERRGGPEERRTRGRKSGRDGDGKINEAARRTERD